MKSLRHKLYDRRRRQAQTELAEAARLRSTGAWKKCRALARQLYPLCCDPFNEHRRAGHTVYTDHVHHVRSLRSRPDLAYDLDNLRGLCTRCHRRVEALERNGLDTVDLFEEPTG